MIIEVGIPCQFLRLFDKPSPSRDDMSGSQEPWIPADMNIKELTTRVVVIGVLLGGVMTAANAYLGLYVGMTVSASIPAAVMSMLILRGFKFKDVTILENNSVQTTDPSAFWSTPSFQIKSLKYREPVKIASFLVWESKNISKYVILTR